MLNPNDRLRYLVEYLNDAVYTVDVATNQFTSLNPAAVKLTGYSSEELRGKNVSDIIAPESMAKVRKMIQKKLQLGQPTVYEVELIHRSGRRIPVEISSRLIVKHGKPSEILGIARDISERKLAERQKEIFLSLITHEIKNPLTTITMYTELMERRAKKANDTEGQGMLRTIQEQARTISYLMNDFLEVNQMQLGKFSLSKESFDVCAAIDEVIRSFTTETATHTIKRVGTRKRTIAADKQRLTQVLVNLLSNAIKYSPEADAVLVRVSAGDHAVTVSVIDYGMGIPKAEHKAIFDLFYRSQKGGNIQGHGLGLYICREIIKSHKGKLWVESEEGKGATFSFSLPV